jgi:hypothetical protein
MSVKSRVSTTPNSVVGNTEIQKKMTPVRATVWLDIPVTQCPRNDDPGF